MVMFLMIKAASTIPKFNVDYGFDDFINSFLHIIAEGDISSINSLFEKSNIAFTNSGRTSLYIILKSLNLPSNSNIGVPLYCCQSVFDAIIHAGHKPVFLDIDMQNYTLNITQLKNKINYLDAIVVVHTFGRPANMNSIKKIAANVPIIEDCAHALLSRYDDQLVGTIGTVSFYTFRTGKYISAGEGSIIVTKNKLLYDAINDNICTLAIPSLANEIKHIFKTYLLSLFYNKPLYGLIALPIGSKLDKKFDFMSKRTFDTYGIRKTDLFMIARKVNEFSVKVKKQKENSEYLINQLAKTNFKLPTEIENTHCNYFMFPILLQTEYERNSLQNILLKNGFDSSTLFSLSPLIARKYYDYLGDCPYTEDIVNKILVIPNYYSLSEKEITRLAQVLKNENKKHFKENM